MPREGLITAHANSSFMLLWYHQLTKKALHGQRRRLYGYSTNAHVKPRCLKTKWPAPTKTVHPCWTKRVARFLPCCNPWLADIPSHCTFLAEGLWRSCSENIFGRPTLTADRLNKWWQWSQRWHLFGSLQQHSSGHRRTKSKGGGNPQKVKSRSIQADRARSKMW